MSKVSTGRIVSLVLVIVVLWFGITYLVVKCGPNVGESGGVKGDAFGAVNALFSGLALAGVIVAILLQSEELKLQRQELTETRTELRGQKEQLEAQVNASMQNEYDTRFLETLRLYMHRVSGVSIDSAVNGTLHGTAGLKYFCGYLSWNKKQQVGGRFQKTEDYLGHQILPAMQVLEVAFQMLSHSNACLFHVSLIKANCGLSDRLAFLHYVLDHSESTPVIGKAINDMAFFKGVTIPAVDVDLQNLTYKAFGLESWQSMGRNPPT
jgi:hypothetical protein